MLNFINDLKDHPGQLFPTEREHIYNIIKELKPDIAVEIGTWKGGGSTFYISTALSENRKGLLYTFEINEEFYNISLELYKRYPTLNKQICFNLGVAEKLIPEIIKDKISFVFFDGCNDPDQTLKQYNAVKPLLADHYFLTVHDWKENKSLKIRKLLEEDCIHVKTLDTLTGFSIWTNK